MNADTPIRCPGHHSLSKEAGHLLCYFRVCEIRRHLYFNMIFIILARRFLRQRGLLVWQWVADNGY